MIPFNKPFLCGNEIEYIRKAVNNGKISGDGWFGRKCQHFFEERYGFNSPLLTSSCTDALEMIALLCNIQPGDEIIAPSFTFVSTVNPFVMNGAHIVFCDVHATYPCINEKEIEKLVSPRTKAIIVMHYAGIACNMHSIMEIARKHNLLIIEDAAHAIDASFNGKPLGGIGHFGAFSFHETKNIIAGEGGMITINDPQFVPRAEIIREKGTNRTAFFRGEVDKYSWVDVGSSFLPSEITASFLLAQLENIDVVQAHRKTLWSKYYQLLQPLQTLGRITLPVIPEYAEHNAHIFYLLTKDEIERAALIDYLRDHDIMAIFHYQPLHRSPFWTAREKAVTLPNTDMFAGRLLRLPMFFELQMVQVEFIVKTISAFYGG